MVHILVNLSARIGSGSILRIVFGGVSERPNRPGYDRWASWGILGGSGSGFRSNNILGKNVSNSAVRHEVHFKEPLDPGNRLNFGLGLEVSLATL